MKRTKRNPAARAYFRAFYDGNRLNFGLTALLTLLGIPVTLSVSWLLGELLDAASARSMEQLVRAVKIFVPIALFYVALDLGTHWVKSRFLCRAMVQYKALAFRRLSEKSISAFSRENTGRYLSILTNDTGTIETNYLESSFRILDNAVLFLGCIGMMLWYSPMLAVIVVAFSVLPIAVAVLTGGMLTRREQEVSEKNEGFMAQIKDLLNGFSVIKSFKAEAAAQRQFDAASQTAEDAKRRRRWSTGQVTTLSGLCGFIMQFGIFFIGTYLAIRGHVTGGTVVVFVNLSGTMLNAIQVVPQCWASRRAAAGLVEKLAAVTEENAGRSGDPIPPVLRDGITLDHVTFAYEPDKPVLSDISLTLEPGKKYALVGGSGSGKSTLLNLLMGGYDGYSGSISIDGRELRSVNPDSLYDLMSLIGQNVFLFDDTIRSNITMFRDFPDHQVEEAVERSGLSQLLERRGADYRCGENGAGLSGGERQRVSIARCLLRGTPVLLLDEATAALDNQTAFAVTDAILHLDGLTRLVVTHRLDETLMAQYDEILVLRNGRIQERGGFRQLMERKGYFYSLYTLTA